MGAVEGCGLKAGWDALVRVWRAWWDIERAGRNTPMTSLCFCLDLFVGQLKSCLKCQACGYRSTTFEVFCDLSLPIPKVGLQKLYGVGIWEGNLGRKAEAWVDWRVGRESSEPADPSFPLASPLYPLPPERICWGQGVTPGLFQPFHQGRGA